MADETVIVEEEKPAQEQVVKPVKKPFPFRKKTDWKTRRLKAINELSDTAKVTKLSRIKFVEKGE